MYRTTCTAIVVSLFVLTGCTAEQWSTTKQVLAASCLVGLAGLASLPPPVTTTCQSTARGSTVRTTCTTY